MRTTGAELRSEAAIHAEGTIWHGRELVAEYEQYADLIQERGEVPDDFQRWWNWWSMAVLTNEQDEIEASEAEDYDA